MASRKEGQYDRLRNDDEDTENADMHFHPGFHGRISSLSCLLISNTILALVIVGLLVRSSYQPPASTASIPYTGVGSVQLLEDQLGLASNVIKTYRFFEDNLDDFDFRKGDPYWSDLFPKGGGQVFLDDEVVAAYKLPPSLRSPTKGNYTAYMMAGYHSMHCLTGLRQVIGKFMAAHKIGEQYDISENKWRHTVHCLADLRQLVLCNLDETLFVFEEGYIHPGYHQKKMLDHLAPVSRTRPTSLIRTPKYYRSLTAKVSERDMLADTPGS
ncbi:hypothetical protein PT974_02974 [Cladobotryum mycophilum]|uniref:Uncharacterized protein n=1 Tax=Cladobotryum mycophilum TaxID=491253 RepID=A0ABR0T0S3_9HYPO